MNPSREAKRPSKLALRRETVRELTALELQGVNAAGEPGIGDDSMLDCDDDPVITQPTTETVDPGFGATGTINTGTCPVQTVLP